jgi:pimeloyl-ACP methyl ester carboxylesterase
VAAELQKLTPKPPIADFGDPGKVGKVVLAAHSGGGKVMLALARTRPKKDQKSPDPYADKVAECWGFDCLYGHPAGARSIPTPVPGPKAGPDEWTAWETRQAQHRETLWRDWLRSSGVEFHLFCATGSQGGGTTTRSMNLDALASRDNLSNVHITYDPNASHHGIIVPRFTERLKIFQV